MLHARIKTGAGQLQIHSGFGAARHPVQQTRSSPPAGMRVFKRRLHIRESALLIIIERKRSWRRRQKALLHGLNHILGILPRQGDVSGGQQRLQWNPCPLPQRTDKMTAASAPC